MTNLGDRLTLSRGQQRCEQLEEAGVALLAEGGWSAVTTRAVAERANANAGLIHYYFGGLTGLQAAIARRAGAEVTNPVVEALLNAQGPASASEALGRLLPATTANVRTLRLAVELIAGMGRDPVLGEVLRDSVRVARGKLAERMGDLYPNWTRQERAGAAALIAALSDGLILHYSLDNELPAEKALTVLAQLIGGEQ
ncbi:TetR/AcrR family transcriptional regulator [Nocardia sp. NRRL WC-3656]|uniref:TetR/AcrR family transcriptional regulator n=1 Tax=Nocardia sp. NRRL WC-3656 TaxID=1463824 RepID=UPI0004C33078|nr:TetR/AcrR family transcriptional regulator [Nocardia sp. NRRL WC-3656]